MRNIVKTSILTLLTFSALHATASMPSQWSELLGKDSASYFVGRADSSPKGSFSMAFSVAEESTLKTPFNPKSPDSFQIYSLKEDGLHYILQFKKGRRTEGVLRDFQQEHSEDGKKVWLFSDPDNDYDFKIVYNPEDSSLTMLPTHNGRSHAIVKLKAVNGPGFLRWAVGL